MIAEAISRIEEKENIESVALKCHTPNSATYIVVDENFNYKIISKERFSFNTKYVTMDFYSQIINLNKALDKKKLISSNNYLSFFCSNFEKLTEEIIDNYYKKTQVPEKSLIYRDWIKGNIFKIYAELREQQKKGKGVIKIKLFFKANINEYIKLNNLYLKNNVLSNTEEISRELFGNSSFINLNIKKPYLRTYSRKVSNPYTVNTEEGIKYKYFADILYSLLRRGKTLLYILEDGTLIPLAEEEMPKRDIFNALLISFGLNSRGNLIINHMDEAARYNYYLK